MTTMLDAENDDKSIQSFRIPLEIVKEDPKYEQHPYLSMPTHGGDLLIIVTYKRNIIKVVFLIYLLYKYIRNSSLFIQNIIHKVNF